MTKPKAQQEKEAAASKRSAGRPSLFKPEQIQMIRTLASHGVSEIRIQEDLGISERTWRRWKAENPQILAALRVSDEEMLEIARTNVVRRMQGYEYRAEKIMTVSMGGGVSEVKRIPYVEHVPPDTTAAMWIMKNRDPANWKDRQEVENRGDVVVRVEGGLPDKEPEK